MSSFFDNFMGGMAFGMLASNPFFRGMGGFGMGCGCGFGGVGGFIFGGMYNAVNLTGFVNPFPSIFGGYGLGFGGGYASSDLMMPTTFANPYFPSADFSTVGQTIWDMYTNPNSDYNKTMRDWYESMNRSQNPFASVTDKPKEEKTEKADEDKAEKDNSKAENDKTKDAELKKSEKKAQKNNKVTLPETSQENVKAEQSEEKEIVYDAKALKEKWSSKAKTFDDKCFKKVVKISKKIKCDPDDLMAIMNLETNRTFSTSVKNPGSSATGLIQFTEDTAKTLGTTIDKLKKMSVLEQLNYVEKYFIYWRKEKGFKKDDILDAGRLYALVFQPANVNKEILAMSGTKEYRKNELLDANKDGKITKADLSEKLKAFMA